MYHTRMVARSFDVCCWEIQCQANDWPENPQGESDGDGDVDYCHHSRSFHFSSSLQGCGQQPDCNLPYTRDTQSGAPAISWFIIPLN